MPAMSLNAADKCPHCGTPYMSMLKEGEDPSGRYCYTCETTAGGAQMAATLEAAAGGHADDELQLIPNEGDAPEGGPRRGGMAPGRRPNFKPAAKSGPRPATGSRNNMPAVTGSHAQMPAITGSRAQMPAVTGSRASMPAVTGSRNNLPAVSGSHGNMPAVAASRATMPAVPAPEYEEIEIETEEELQQQPQQPEQRPSRAGFPAARRGSSVSLIPVTDKKGSTVNLIAVGDMKKGSSVNMIPAVKSHSGKHHAARSSQRMNAVPGGKTSAMMTAVAMPSGRSSARQKAVDDQKKKNMVLYGAIGGGVLVIALMAYAFGGSKKPLPDLREAETKPSTPKEETRVALAPLTPSAADTTTKAAPVSAEQKNDATAKTEKTDKAAKVEETTAKAGEEKKEAGEVAATPAPETDKNANVTDALANVGTRKAANAKLDDDDADAGPRTKRSAPAAQESKPAAAAPGNTPPAPPALGPDGEPKKNGGDPMVALGLKKKEPEKEDPKPGSKPAPVVITATEPTIVPIDFGKGDRNQETTFSESVNRILPGWRVRDLKLEASSASSEQRGRPECVSFQPLNDVLPTKFIATVEIPQSYAQKRPMLMFEASVKEGTAKGSAKPMFISVKVTNLDVNPRQQMEIFPKQMVKGTKEQPWLDSVVDLSMLAGRRAEIQIEVSVPPKTKPEVLKDYIGYVRGLRLEWAGKPRTAAPAKPKP